jgi:hypothetical protein
MLEKTLAQSQTERKRAANPLICKWRLIFGQACLPINRLSRGLPVDRRSVRNLIRVFVEVL